MNSSNSSKIGTLLSPEKIFRETNLHCATIWFISEKADFTKFFQKFGERKLP